MRSDTSSAADSDAGVGRVYAVVLGVGTACALAIAVAHEFTRPIVRRNREAYRNRAILDVLQNATDVTPFRWDRDARRFQPAEADHSDTADLFAGFDPQGAPVGVAIEARATGYQDTIRFLYGYAFDERAIVGFSVLESRETPGLGDRIESEPAFLNHFRRLPVTPADDGSGLAHPIEFVKPGEKTEPWQIDGITGATVSSRAVVEAMAQSAARWIPRVSGRRSNFVPDEAKGGNRH